MKSVFKIQKIANAKNVGEYQQECIKNRFEFGENLLFSANKFAEYILSKSKVLLHYFFSAPLQNLSISLK